MKNGAFVNRIFSAFAAAVFTFMIFAAVGRAADNSGASGVSIDEQRQTIENYYKGLIDEIQRRVESSVMEINDTSGAERQKAEAIKRTSIAEDLHEERSGQILSTDALSEYEKERAQNEKDIRNRAENEIKYLEERKSQELEALGGSGEVRRLPSGPIVAPGTVTGIVYYNDSGAALIGGEVVRENDVVMDVKISKVLPDYVEFEKQGKKWKQAVGQTPPASVWEKKQKPKPATQSSASPNSNTSPSSNSKPNPTPAVKPNPVPKSNTSTKPAASPKTSTGNKAKSGSKDIQ
jgi:hypothetical protein